MFVLKIQGNSAVDWRKTLGVNLGRITDLRQLHRKWKLSWPGWNSNSQQWEASAYKSDIITHLEKSPNDPSTDPRLFTASVIYFSPIFSCHLYFRNVCIHLKKKHGSRCRSFAVSVYQLLLIKFSFQNTRTLWRKTKISEKTFGFVLKNLLRIWHRC